MVAAKSRNYTVLDLLLSRGASPHIADSLGVSPLHYEAGQGDCEAVKLMLAYGADPNKQDSLCRTPLHYAVVGQHVDTVDLLVFCGADAYVANQDGESPMSLTQNRSLRTLMKSSELIVRGINNWNVHLEHLTLTADTVYQLEDTGLTVRTPGAMGLARTSLLVRRVVPEYSMLGPGPDQQELLLSDIYDFRISGAYLEEPLMLQVPVFSRVDDHEDVFLKTDQGSYSSALKVSRLPGETKASPRWVCQARLCLHDVRSMVLVARPRTETCHVTPSGRDFTSGLDPQVRLQLRQGALTEKCDVTLQVLSKPSYDEEQFDSIISMSHFYQLSSSGTAPLNNDALLTLPLPENYLGHGLLHVLMSRDAGESGETWEELLRNPDYAKDVVKLRVTHFGRLCLLETNPQYHVREMINSSTAAVDMVNRLYRKSKRQEYNACFLALGKPRSGSKSGSSTADDAAEVVVETVVSCRLHDRLQYWKGQGYVDLRPSHTVEFTACPTQEFVITPSGCCMAVDLDTPPLQFHPKRNNHVTFTVRRDDVIGCDVGQVHVYIRRVKDVPRSGHSSDITELMDSTSSPTSRQHDELLATIPVYLPWAAPPGVTRGQDIESKVVTSPFVTVADGSDTCGDTESPTLRDRSTRPYSPVVKHRQGTPLCLPECVSHHAKLPLTLQREHLGKPEDQLAQPKPTPSAQGPQVAVSRSPVTSARHLKSASRGGSSIRSRPDSRTRQGITTHGTNNSTSKSRLNQSQRLRSERKNSSAEQWESQASVRDIHISTTTPRPPASTVLDPGTGSDHSLDCTDSPEQRDSASPGVLDWLAGGVTGDWPKLGILLGVQYDRIQALEQDESFTPQRRAAEMLHQWRVSHKARPDHGVVQLLVSLQQLGRRDLVRGVTDRLRHWISENLEHRGYLKGRVFKHQMDDQGSLEPMSPPFLLALVRRLGFNLDLVYALGVSRPEVTHVMNDPLRRHREDKMLALLIICRDKESWLISSLDKIITALSRYNLNDSVQWILGVSLNWLRLRGSADDTFAHDVRDLLEKYDVTLKLQAPS